ncbi:hypothetical protein GGP81_003321 [Salinibacter ruber]|uniref:hypothetical protein n=1 Tax=Salinibacter ruber TaxID=146919 RepID=UPI002169EF93|nr:hypothetical protein [Salinibacter ruber]MCS3956773.1 hypothetical protein [Salinibacter ruber]
MSKLDRMKPIRRARIFVIISSVYGDLKPEAKKRASEYCKILEEEKDKDLERIKRKNKEAGKINNMAEDRYGLKENIDKMEEIIPLERYSIEDTLILGIEELEKVLSTDKFAEISGLGERWPAHVRWAVRPAGVQQPEVRYRPPGALQLDRRLYEDMAVLCNKTVDLPEEDQSLRQESLSVKALSRSVIQSAVNFLEGYVNCLGYNIQHYLDYDDEHNEVVSSDDPRESVYEKLKKYQKIALPDSVSSLTKGDAVLQKLLDARKRFRHSITHPSPRRQKINTGHDFPSRFPEDWLVRAGEEDASPDPEKEIAFIDVRPDLATEICDAVVEVVKSLERKLEGQYSAASRWLYERNESGKFPEEAFRGSADREFPAWASGLR